MKKSLRATIAVAVLVLLASLVFAAPAFAGAKAPAVPAGASFELVQDMGVQGGAFWLYSPSRPYNHAVLSRELNSVMFVYPNAAYQTQAAAWKAMGDNGLIKLAEENAIYVVMPKPMNGAAWSPADLTLYKGIQSWLFGGNSAPPFLQWQYMPLRSGSSRTYVVAEGDGATFVHDVLSKNANRIAGMLAFGGTMTNFTKGLAVPAYLVHTDAATVQYYKTVNGATSQPSAGTFVNSALPLQAVVTAHLGGPLFVKFQPFTRFTPAIIADAWNKMFSKTSRTNVHGAMVIDDSVWYLNDRPNYAALGITRVDHVNDASLTGSAVTWYEFVPDSIKKQPTAKVPLVIVAHGLCGDPIDQAESTGWVNKAAEKGFIVISPAYTPPNAMADWAATEALILKLVDYAKATYPIDASRVYLAGYSMGGMTSSIVGLKNPSMFAAIGVMGANGPAEPFTGAVMPDVVAAVNAVKGSIDLPFLVLRGALEATQVGGFPAIEGFATAGLPLLDMNELPHGTPDYKAYPFWGFATTNAEVQVSKTLHFDVSYMYKEGEALGKFVIFEEGAHTHEDYYATLCWDFFSQFTR
jgi:pimeloyl-ACP methyl ester carboxylesterase